MKQKLKDKHWNWVSKEVRKQTLKEFSERLKKELRKDAVIDIGGIDKLKINYLKVSLKIINKIKKELEEK